MTSLVNQEVDRLVESWINRELADDYCYNFLMDAKQEDCDSDCDSDCVGYEDMYDWDNVGHSRDCRYFFEERFYDRIPCSQPIITHAEWSICNLVNILVHDKGIMEVCEGIAKVTHSKCWLVEQSMIHSLYSFIINTALSIG